MEPVQINAEAIRRLDLTPLQPWSSQPLASLLELGPALELQFDWPREPSLGHGCVRQCDH